MSQIVYQEHDESFKFNVALKAMAGDKKISELSQEFGVGASLIYEWKNKLKREGATLFVDKRCAINKDQEELVERLEATIKKLEAENDFLARVFNQLPKNNANK